MSLFGKMNHAFAKAMRMKIWPFYAISVSTCCVKKNRLVLASMPNVSRRVGTTIIFSAFWMGLFRCDCPGELPLPAEIAAGIDDVSQRTQWNKAAPETYALPTETWREVIAR